MVFPPLLPFFFETSHESRRCRRRHGTGLLMPPDQPYLNGLDGTAAAERGGTAVNAAADRGGLDPAGRPSVPRLLRCPNKAEKYDSLILGSANLQLDDHIEGRRRLREIPTMTDVGTAAFAVPPFNWSSQMHLRSEPMRRGNMYLRRGQREARGVRDKSAPHHISILQRFWWW